MEELAKKGKMLAKAVYNAATHPDQHQSPPNSTQAQPHQPYQPTSTLSPQFHHQYSNQQPSQWSQQGFTPPIPQQHAPVAPPAPYSSPAYHGLPPSSPTPPHSTFSDVAPFSPIPNTSLPAGLSYPNSQPVLAPAPNQAQWPLQVPPPNPSSWQSVSPAPGVTTQIPLTPAVPPSPMTHTTTPSYTQQSSFALPQAIPPPGHAVMDQSIGTTSQSIRPDLQHTQSLPSPIGHTPFINHPNSLPPNNNQSATTSYVPNVSTRPIGSGLAGNPPTSLSSTNAHMSPPNLPQSESQSFIAELPADMPIELPAELPAHMSTTPPSNLAHSTVPPPLDYTTHPSVGLQTHGTQQIFSTVHHGLASPPPPLHATSADSSINYLEQPKPVHPESTPMATAQQIASMTPISPPPTHSSHFAQPPQGQMQSGSTGIANVPGIPPFPPGNLQQTGHNIGPVPPNPPLAPQQLPHSYSYQTANNSGPTQFTGAYPPAQGQPYRPYHPAGPPT